LVEQGHGHKEQDQRQQSPIIEHRFFIHPINMAGLRQTRNSRSSDGGFFFGAIMANAPYEVNVSGTDDETFHFAIPFENADGSAFPFDQYEIEYALSHFGERRLFLSQAAGVTIDNRTVVFSAGTPLQQGNYEHGCRIRRITTGQLIQVFDGTVTIGEGNF
jgi:hypothetical protein